MRQCNWQAGRQAGSMHKAPTTPKEAVALRSRLTQRLCASVRPVDGLAARKRHIERQRLTKSGHVNLQGRSPEQQGMVA